MRARMICLIVIAHAVFPWVSDAGATASVWKRELPLPERNWSLIQRIGIAAKIDPGASEYYPQTKVHGSLDIGAVRNLSPSFGLGGNFYLGVDDRRSRFGIKARSTQWFSRNVAFDLAPGILLAGGDSGDGGSEYPGFVGDATLTLYGCVHLAAQVESVKLTHPTLPGRRDTSWYIGAQGTGPRGALVLVGGGLAFLAVRGLLFLAQG